MHLPISYDLSYRLGQLLPHTCRSLLYLQWNCAAKPASSLGVRQCWSRGFQLTRLHSQSPHHKTKSSTLFSFTSLGDSRIDPWIISQDEENPKSCLSQPWLPDLLAPRLPSARIFTFGYDGKELLRSPRAISDFAVDLLAGVHEQRGQVLKVLYPSPILLALYSLQAHIILFEC